MGLLFRRTRLTRACVVTRNLMGSRTSVLVSQKCISDKTFEAVANKCVGNDWGPAGVNITQVGDFTEVPYKYKLSPLFLVKTAAKLATGVGKI